MSTKIEDGGTAFPSKVVSRLVAREIPNSFGQMEAVPEYTETKGMSLRDWFAGQAVIGIAEPMMQAGFKEKISVERQAENIAAAAYFIADKMISARKAGEQ